MRWLLAIATQTIAGRSIWLTPAFVARTAPRLELCIKALLTKVYWS